jgi:hypothetical protein
MFRRRGLVRPIHPLGPVEIPPALQRANQLMASGQYAPAAEIYEQFAQGAVRRNGPRAPWFLLQAGRARILAGQIPAGMMHIRQGLSIFAGTGQWGALQKAGMSWVAELNERGLHAEAGEITKYLESTLPAGVRAPEPVSSRETLLPTKCPSCGAPIRSDEVEWADDATAECPYCGSAVRAE